MKRTITSDAGNPMIVEAEQTGNVVRFSTPISKGRAAYNVVTREWLPMRIEFGGSIKAKILKAFEL